MNSSVKLSKRSKGLTWQQNRFVDMRMDNAYIETLESLSFALSHENVAWLLSPVAGWNVAVNTPVESKYSTKGPFKGQIVSDNDLDNRAKKARWRADPAVYGHIQTKAYVEHPYEKQPTKDFIKVGVLAACSRGMSSRLIANQVAEIIDSRLDCVLVPASEDQNTSQPHSTIKDLIGSKKDGMVQKYSKIALVDSETQAKLTLADLQKADDDMQRRVETAMTILTGTTWVFPGRSVAAVSNQGGPIAPAKTSNAATLLEVTNAHVQSVIDELGLTARKKPKDISSGWSLYGLKGKVFSGLKADEHCSVSTMGLTNPAIGGIMTPLGELRLSRLTIDEFEKYVQLHR